MSQTRRSLCRGWARRWAIAAIALASVLASMPVYAAGGILVFGDSLSAAHGIAQSDGWVALLRERLEKKSKDIEVANASISGETTAGGKARLPEALDRYQPSIVVLELGGNDGLRALPVADMKANLNAMIEASRAAGAKVLLLGMRIPTNYGKAYSDGFHRVFDTIAKDHDVAYVPFFLKPIALDRSNFQADGIHPTAAAQPALLDAVWPKLSALMKSIPSRE